MKDLKLRDIGEHNLNWKSGSAKYPASIQSWIWKATQYLERAIHKRTCHLCKCAIKSKEAHLAFYQKNSYVHWHVRTNICVFCAEALVKTMKKSIKGSIKERKQQRKVEILLEEL